MRTIALINTDGSISHTIRVASKTEFTDGTAYLGYLCKDVTGMDITNKYWTGSVFADMPARPGECYNWNGSSWVFDKEAELAQVQVKRNNLLFSSDWTQLPDAPLTDGQKKAYADYRQALRNFPSTLQHITHHLDVVWPTRPST